MAPTAPPPTDTAFDLAAYRRRIGHSGDTAPTAQTLSELIACHARSIPFENFDVLARRVPSLNLGALQAKLVQGRRGGYCYEQNSLFMAALQVMGFEVRALEARVRTLAAPDAVTGRSHMALRVTLAGVDHLADVGFGGLAPLAPLRLHETAPQAAPGSLYRWVDVAGERRLQIEGRQGWSDCYSVIDRDLHPADREIGNWYAATYPRFALALNLSLGVATRDHRLALWNLRLSRRPLDGGLPQEMLIGSRAELADLVADSFGLALPPGDLDAAYAVAEAAMAREAG